jgi:2-amino-4-hydroxy-6-hydroxymethyldihydropteridine diphosphokinase
MGLPHLVHLRQQPAGILTFDYTLSLGSNIDPERSLPAALRLLSRFGEVLAVSGVYESPPLGGARQKNYLNAAVLFRSPLRPDEFHTIAIGTVEKELGRVRTADKYAPRTIDVDILLIGSFVGEAAGRKIPSDEIVQRAFVAVPLGEIAPHTSHPETGQTLGEIAAGFARDSLLPRPDVILMP